MSWLPISQTVPQYQNASDENYSGAVLKFYAAGTSTNISVATDNTGGTTATSIALNADGYPEVSGSIIIPHVDQAYKIALYATQAAADADTGAIWTVDNITPAAINTVGADESVKVSANDTTAGYLNAKAVVGDSITFTENSDGGNETLTISIEEERRNYLINGDMRVAQQGTSFDSTTTPANNDDTYTLDQWILLSDGNDRADVSQQTGGGVSGNDTYIRLDTETVSKKFGIFQPIENCDLFGLIGGTASLSFEARVSDATKMSDIRAVVVSWSSTADSITSDIISAWGAEGANPTLATNWTAENTAANLSVTSSWAKYTITNISIDTASCANVGVFIYQNNVATNDTLGTLLEITKVSLRRGANATGFIHRNFQEEDIFSRRYYEKYGADRAIANVFFDSTSSAEGVFFYTPKRIAPTVAAVGSGFQLRGFAGESLSSLAFSNITQVNAMIQWNDAATPFTANQASVLESTAAGSYLTIDARL